MLDVAKRASGCLFGLAFGDALAADAEFLNVEQILRRYPPNGPQGLHGTPARVTDDTQMTLAVGEALLEAPLPYRVATLEAPLRHAFVAWSRSPDNDRAPGNTCMNACSKLARGLPWYKATVLPSKGCGANMRVAPVGLVPTIDAATRAAIAQFQAALTHGHPTALAASDLTSFAIADLMAGSEPLDLPCRLRAYAESQRTCYHADWLGSLWQEFGAASPAAFIAVGWDECLAVLERLERAIASGDRENDPCLATGDGWIAEEAFATGLLCFLLFPDSPVSALRRAAVTRGDSDSIACLTGAFAGASAGLSVWPTEWIEQIEYRERLAYLSEMWDK